MLPQSGQDRRDGGSGLGIHGHPARRIGDSGQACTDHLVAADIMVEGVSGMLSLASKQRIRVKWEPSRNRLTWPKGTIAQLFSGDHADGLRGSEHHVAWCDELAKWRRWWRSTAYC